MELALALSVDSFGYWPISVKVIRCRTIEFYRQIYALATSDFIYSRLCDADENFKDYLKVF